MNNLSLDLLHNSHSIRHTPRLLFIVGLLILGSAEAFQPSSPISAPASAPVPASLEMPSEQRQQSVALDLASLRRAAEEVLAELAENTEGELYSGAVEGTNPDDLALAVALMDGRSFTVGRAETPFPLMSISKPFTYALTLEQRGVDFMIDKIGVSATGLPYNNVAAGAIRETSEQNPFVNAGAIATHSFVQGAGPEEKISAVIALYSAMANAPLKIEEAWRAQPRALTYTLAYQMQAAGRLDGDVEDVAERYLEACIVGVKVEELARMGATVVVVIVVVIEQEELARMGATLANAGIQPNSGQRILSPANVRTLLSAMTIAGLYEDSGRWWTRVGLPAKSGVSGAILAVAPGWGAIVAYSPRLDSAGNSIRGALAIQQLADRWRLHSIGRLLGE